MRNHFIIFLSCLIFCGCVSSYGRYGTRLEHFSVPPLDEIVTASIGDVLVEQGDRTSGFAVVIPSDDRLGYFPKGTYFATGIREATDMNGNKGSVYRFDDKRIEPWYYSGNAYRTWLEYNSMKDTLSLKREGWGGLLVNVSDVLSFRTAETVEEERDFQQTLIYLGKSGKLLRFGYREFYKDIARPAFSTEVSYDLGDSDIIGYKKARIQVISATNTSITYKVLSYFD